MTMAMVTRMWSKLMAVSIASPGEESGDAAAPLIEKVELRMENVSKSYGGRQVVDGMLMSVRQGEVVGLLGLQWSREEHSVQHHGVARLGIGYMTQESSVFRGLSGHDNIHVPRPVREEILSWGELSAVVILFCEGHPSM